MKGPSIVVKGARAHNLKGVDIELPKNKLIVMTGLSGSGKSSLAFDTIYAEGQRRYVESLSAYARQFLGQMDKPDVDTIEGLSPAISIDQKTTSKNPRSTVATVTEIYDYIRLLYARVGKPYCPYHGIEIESQTVQQMVDRILELEERTKIQLLAPVISHRKGSHEKLIEDIGKKGYVRLRVDDEIVDVNEVPQLDKNKNHTIEVVVDRLVVKDGIETRLADSIETALELAEGNLTVDVINGEELKFSENHACPICGFSIGELEPRMFSFNSPFGACPTCDGLGQKLKVDLDLVIPDKNKTLNEGAIEPWEPTSSDFYPTLLKRVCEVYKINMDKPYKKLTDRQKNILMNGSGEKEIEFTFTQRNGGTRKRKMVFEGVVPNIDRRYHESPSEYTREMMSKYMTELPCETCHGKRLSKEALSVYVGDYNIGEVVEYSIKNALYYFENLKLSDQDKSIADQILKEIISRLSFLNNVGLEYLTLDRSSGTLSGGEAQRIRLATQIGSRLTGVLYVLDEPSIGLHQRDNDRLINTLKEMRDLGNTLIVVEHDDDTMRAADYLVDVGPGAGNHGGEVVSSGTPNKVMKDKKSLTGQYLSGKKRIEVPEYRREITDRKIQIKGAKSNNLKNVNVDFPLSVLTVVTGVSGSGKSSLVNEILYKALAQKINKSKVKPGNFDEIKGIDQLDKIIDIDQSPIGRTPRSNPATYTGVFDDIRDVFAQTNEAKIRGYQKGRFSFNVKGGRCEACKGDGIIKIEMHFLPDVYVPCEVCDGKRYNRETLEVTYKGKNIADVLEMTVEEATHFFENIPKIKRKLQTLVDVGLGYITLGQQGTTLSGGEAQRVKLASELHKRSTGRSIYILDEPTTGLHVDDISRLLKVLNRIVENGDTVVIIEHNLDVIKTADHIIDLGPEGGEGGGTIIATGTPEEIAQNKGSYTGQYLKPVLERDSVE
ncbi:excinuclease ABC subunit UvrA [Staphylococcus epidermidis]|jgi:excinuclease ABC subunit A|uniref:UvrABC system protein A n=1 Tax=Staphylococcus epidermidis (strain ATCC 12228 / FDA PCI 1200) TaxID=176280 RepID=UVRA_STAES|nr:excinuclease ABC subunit UvrA [Staphylococcus epidermidis]Q8CPY9.1 RecName: Full=UvrABC system protein A; Short=UvrA protein; AltName: Full=Excinuclease ABC subunit A [Staphylococcus epidermidis ATCC 12228]EHQ72453.1 excinuclease ABC, A subunit [Staphylococcus epidermidis VCU057]AAO04139.1 exinuclease ABC subunit A [Staphylococcus epidermidis ATCC 12228]EHQ80684.1 excinuclease ABC, A subunit [Staphylococcus epidermidis VCU065]KAB1899317.1 excinuclease ABC subunit UvrA [Staphylococcus epider